MLQKILHTLRRQPEYATVTLPTKPVIGPGQVAASKRFSSPLLSYSFTSELSANLTVHTVGNMQKITIYIQNVVIRPDALLGPSDVGKRATIPMMTSLFN